MPWDDLNKLGKTGLPRWVSCFSIDSSSRKENFCSVALPSYGYLDAIIPICIFIKNSNGHRELIQIFDY